MQAYTQRWRKIFSVSGSVGFPSSNCLRSFYPKARRTVYGTAILHNLAVMWGDDEVEEEADEEDNMDKILPAYGRWSG